MQRPEDSKDQSLEQLAFSTDMLEKLLSKFIVPEVKATLGSVQSQRLIQAGWSGLRPYWHPHTQSIRKEVGIGEWKRIVSASNQLYWNFGVVAGAIEDKSMLAVGRQWLPIFCGEDREWGKQATEWLINQFYPIAYTDGSDFQSKLYLDSVAVDRDGDVATLYTETRDGYPQFQQIPWHAIGSRDQRDYLEQGAYKGLREYNGVILNKQGRPIAFRVLGEKRELDREISAFSMDFLFEPKVPDQVRGFPCFTSALLDLRDLTTVQGYVRQAAMLASSIGLIEHNEIGMADPNDPAYQLMNMEAPKNPTQLIGEELYGGTVRYFRAGSGSKLEQMKNDTPSEATDRLMERLIRNALIGAGMPPEYYWKPEGTGANVRLIISKVNRTINDRQDLIRSVALRRIGYAISKAIKIGILPKYKGADLGGSLKWNFTLPPVLTVDAGYANQDTREAYKLGMKNLTEILGEQGKTLEQHIEERAFEEMRIREAMEKYDLPQSSFRMLTKDGNPLDQQNEDQMENESDTESEDSKDKQDQPVTKEQED